MLLPGSRLPAVRQLAGDLGLAVGTVARAYQELDAAGHVLIRRGGGITVAPNADLSGRGSGGAAVGAGAAQEYVAAVRTLRASDYEALAAVKAALVDHAAEPKPRATRRESIESQRPPSIPRPR